MKRALCTSVALLFAALTAAAAITAAGCRKPPAQAPDARPPAAPSKIQGLAAGFLRKDGEVLVTPPVTTLDAMAPEGLPVEFYAKSATSPVRYVGKARANGAHYTFLWTLPQDIGPEIKVWPWVGPEGDPAFPPPRTPFITVRALPAGNKAAEGDGFPLFPPFSWHADLSPDERTELTDLLKAGWEKGTRSVWYGGRLQDVSPAEAREWTVAEARVRGWDVPAPAGSGEAGWSLVATRGTDRVAVDFAQVQSPGLFEQPGAGYAMVVRLMDDGMDVQGTARLIIEGGEG